MIFGKTDDKSMRIEKALTVASGPLTIDDICRLVFGQITERDRNLVRVVLHRLDGRGILVKHAQTYEVVPAECEKCHQGFPPKTRSMRDAHLCVECTRETP
jgi:predicted Zn-ribbon and HTH transcriptional regulator